MLFYGSLVLKTWGELQTERTQACHTWVSNPTLFLFCWKDMVLPIDQNLTNVMFLLERRHTDRGSMTETKWWRKRDDWNKERERRGYRWRESVGKCAPDSSPGQLKFCHYFKVVIYLRSTAEVKVQRQRPFPNPLKTPDWQQSASRRHRLGNKARVKTAGDLVCHF